MAITLYDATVLGFMQTVNAMQGVMTRALEHCTQTGLAAHELVETRLAADMLPFRFQILSVIHHSVGAIEGAKRGEFRPPGESPAFDYAALQNALTQASAQLASYASADINALEGREVVFKVPSMTIPFTAESFLLSFSMPNFHFHATTAYDILRTKGVPLGKRDYLGSPRIKR
ncbi:MAG: DUF1993 domain-containing protein [Steroidobacteraceae bacterium]